MDKQSEKSNTEIIACKESHSDYAHEILEQDYQIKMEGEK